MCFFFTVVFYTAETLEMVVCGLSKISEGRQDGFFTRHRTLAYTWKIVNRTAIQPND